jgi:hypothetical protein
MARIDANDSGSSEPLPAQSEIWRGAPAPPAQPMAIGLSGLPEAPVTSSGAATKRAS